MELKVFDSSHKDALMDMLKERSMAQQLVDDLPKHGVVIYKSGTPVGALFLRLVEGNYGILDSFITNPKSDAKDRSEAIEKGFEQLLELSKNLNIKRLLTFSEEDSLVRRAKHVGFTFLPMNLGIRDV